MEITRQFAAAEAAKGDVFSALGIDWMMLIFQVIAFIILVWLLAKFVYPWLMKSVDERQSAIDAAAKASAAAQADAAEAEARIKKLLTEARTEADDIVASAKLEAGASLSATEAKAKKRADQIVADAHSQISKDVVAAKQALHNETLELVTLATEKILGQAVSGAVDEKIITRAVKEAK